jgi:hypothetical protein
MSVNDLFARTGPIPKPEKAKKPRTARQRKRNRIKVRNRRRKLAEAPVIAQVRAECVERDKYCVVATRCGIEGECKGESVWGHLRGWRRSKTRKMAPEKRHSSLWTAMFCQFHDRLEESGQYEIVFHTSNYADGRISWAKRVQKSEAA